MPILGKKEKNHVIFRHPEEHLKSNKLVTLKMVSNDG